MKFLLYCSFYACCLIADQLAAQTEWNDDLWTVELIVFAHRDDRQSWREISQLSDFREISSMPPAMTPSADSRPMDPFFSERMHTAWQRLSAGHEPIAYYAWQQRQGRGAARRIHDLQALDRDTSLALGPHYQLDGRARISSSEFGYADFDLQQRTPVTYFDSPPEQQPSALPGEQSAPAGVSEPESGWRVRRVQEQRRINAGRMEYFDSPGLAVLLLVSEPASETEQAAAENDEP